VSQFPPISSVEYWNIESAVNAGISLAIDLQKCYFDLTSSSLAKLSCGLGRKIMDCNTVVVDEYSILGKKKAVRVWLTMVQMQK
jgi:hypothetical protein